MSPLSSLGLYVITHKQTHNNRIAAPRFCTLRGEVKARIFSRFLSRGLNGQINALKYS